MPSHQIETNSRHDRFVALYALNDDYHSGVSSNRTVPLKNEPLTLTRWIHQTVFDSQILLSFAKVHGLNRSHIFFNGLLVYVCFPIHSELFSDFSKIFVCLLFYVICLLPSIYFRCLVHGLAVSFRLRSHFLLSFLCFRVRFIVHFDFCSKHSYDKKLIHAKGKELHMLFFATA